MNKLYEDKEIILYGLISTIISAIGTIVLFVVFWIK